MNTYILKKTLLQVLRMISLLIAISIVTFTLVELSPIDPVEAYIGTEDNVSAEQKAQIAEYWGLNEPPMKRLGKWANNLLHGDFGTSMIYRQPVLKIIKEKFLTSLALMGTSWIISGFVGFFLGILAAYKRGSLLDRIVKAYCLLMQSSPTFWLGLILMLIFAVWLKILPIGLAMPVGAIASEVTILERIRHMILPTMALSLTGITNIALHTREKLNQVLVSDYALFAKARGESTWSIIRHHGIRNILLPAVTLQFGSLNELFGGSVLAENVFSYPGLGQATVAAGIKGDLPLLLGIAICSAVFVICGNLMANLLYPVVDPRIREGYRDE